MVGVVVNGNGAPAPPATGAEPEIQAAAAFLSARASLPSLPTDIDSLVSAGDSVGATRALATAFVAALDAPVGAEGDADSLEGCAQVLLLWVKECHMDATLVAEIAASLAAGTSMGKLRLSCLVLLYNAVPEDQGQLRFELLANTINLAAAAGLMHMITNTFLPSVDRYLAQWAVSVGEKRRMYRVCCDATQSAGLAAESFAFNVKCLELYHGASEGELADEQSAAIHAVKDAVLLPSLYRFDTLLELAPVKRLADSSDASLVVLYDLLKIFVKEDLDAYKAFTTANSSALAELSIADDVCVDKMRLLTFASLGIDCQDLPYDMIATALHIDEAQVEEWVIRAISSGLVDAKINQLRSSVAIYRSTQRMFTREEWQPLSERINIWKVNISDLLDSLRETRQQSSNAAAAAYTG
jgi:translation initiation factor 3 subunit M